MKPGLKKFTTVISKTLGVLRSVTLSILALISLLTLISTILIKESLTHSGIAPFAIMITLLTISIILFLPFDIKISKAVFKKGKLGTIFKVLFLILVTVCRIGSIAGHIFYIDEFKGEFIIAYKSLRPVTEEEYAKLESLITDGELYDVLNEIRDYPDDRFEMNRLAAVNFKASVSRVTDPSFKKRKINDTLPHRLNFFDTDDIFLSDSLLNNYDSVWGTHIPREEMATLLLALLSEERLAAKYSTRAETLLKQIDSDNPMFDKMKADHYASNLEVEKAKNWYGSYIEKCEKKNISVLPEARAYVEERKAGEEAREQFYTEAIKQMPDAFFGSYESDREKISLFNHKDIMWYDSYLERLINGSYYGTPEYKGIFAVANALWGSAGVEPKNPAAFEMISGISPFHSADEFKFTHFNGTFFKWIQKNMVPDPTEKLDNEPYWKIYTSLFKRDLRNLYLAYYYLENGTGRNVDRIADDFIRALRRDEGAGYSFFDNYNNVSFPDAISSEDDNYYIAGTTGILIRRVMDGSYKDFTNLLTYVMNLYDSEWKDVVDQYCQGYWEGDDYEEYDEYEDYGGYDGH